MESVLQYHHVSVQYDRETIVQDISFQVHAGEIVGIIGPSGSGKSTLLKGAMQLLGPKGTVAHGDIRLNGLSLLHLSEKEKLSLYGTVIAMIFQDASTTFAPMRTIGSQIQETLAVHRGMNKTEAKRGVLDLFQHVSMPDGERVWNSYPCMLSGGMLQRAVIVLAMALKPKVLLADEPTSALDVCAQRDVLETLRWAQQELGTAIVLVTHDMAVIQALADTVLVLHQGRCIEQGTVQQIMKQPQQTYTKAFIQAMPTWRRYR